MGGKAPATKNAMGEYERAGGVVWVSDRTPDLIGGNKIGYHCTVNGFQPLQPVAQADHEPIPTCPKMETKMRNPA
jgi:hypothetical protein